VSALIRLSDGSMWSPASALSSSASTALNSASTRSSCSRRRSARLAGPRSQWPRSVSAPAGRPARRGSAQVRPAGVLAGLDAGDHVGGRALGELGVAELALYGELLLRRPSSLSAGRARRPRRSCPRCPARPGPGRAVRRSQADLDRGRRGEAVLHRAEPAARAPPAAGPPRAAESAPTAGGTHWRAAALSAPEPAHSVTSFWTAAIRPRPAASDPTRPAPSAGPGGHPSDSPPVNAVHSVR